MEDVRSAENYEARDLYSHLIPPTTFMLLKESDACPSALTSARKQPAHLKQALDWASQPFSNSRTDAIRFLFRGDKEALKKRLCDWVEERKDYLERESLWRIWCNLAVERKLSQLRRRRPLGTKFCTIWLDLIMMSACDEDAKDQKLEAMELDLIAAWLFASSLLATGATISGWFERVVEFAQGFAMFPESISAAREQNLEAELFVTHALMEMTNHEKNLIKISIRDQLDHVTNMERFRKVQIAEFTDGFQRELRAINRRTEKTLRKKNKARAQNRSKGPGDPAAETNETGEAKEKEEAAAAYQAQLSADSQRALAGLVRLGLIDDCSTGKR